MSAVVQGLVSTRDCAWSGGYSAFLICCAAHTTINGFVLEDQLAQLRKSKNKKERKFFLIFSQTLLFLVILLNSDVERVFIESEKGDNENK